MASVKQAAVARPWCGCKPELTRFKLSRVYYMVECTDPGCKMAPSTPAERTRALAIAVWNERRGKRV